MLALLIGLIAVALAFDVLNGRNDAANSIATIVSTRVPSPRYAVAWAAFFNFVAFFVFGLHVANTIGRGCGRHRALTANRHDDCAAAGVSCLLLVSSCGARTRQRDFSRGP